MASKPAFRIPTFYRPREDVAAWARTARPGESTQYAVGPAIDQNEPVVRLVAELMRSRLVVPVKARQDAQDGGRLVHSVQRVNPIAPAAARSRRLVRDEGYEETDEGRMFLVLVRYANFGMPCPSYGELASQAKLRDRQAARYMLTKLEKAGRIRIEQGEANRIITITMSGAKTPDISAKE